MNGHDFPEASSLPSGSVQDANRAGHPAASTGTFALRRANYRSKTEIQPLSAEQLHTLIRLFRDGNNDAKLKLLACNMYLLIENVKRYAHRDVPLLDLVREGNKGLIHALEEYKVDGGISFSDFADASICRSIERTVMERSDHPCQATPAAASTAHAAHPSKAYQFIVNSTNNCRSQSLSHWL